MPRLQHQVSFAEEIDFSELEFEKVVGKGSFGVVSKGKWRGKYVAVKMIESEEEIKAFRVEVRQLSRVSHPNIVTLYGACTHNPVCLVMEYAEGGSLYNVLHGGPPQAIYTAAHAMSWAKQCAEGVAFLHSMKPKALIHRDLKPANLLLMAGGTELKICDFGTACDVQTYMTNNKGSAAWMAPEVFEGSNYSEKCDVFSWGIILWEVISRRKPFDDIGGPAFRIMWAVHQGTRPPMIRCIPKPLEKLMTRCWAKEPPSRPSMNEVVAVMSNLIKYFRGYDKPLLYEPTEAANKPLFKTVEGEIRTQDSSQTTNSATHSSTLHDTVIRAPEKTDSEQQEKRESEQQTSTSVNTQLLRPEVPARRRSPEYERKRRSADILAYTGSKQDDNEDIEAVLPQVGTDSRTKQSTNHIMGTSQTVGRAGDNRPLRSISLEQKHSGTFEEEMIIPMAYMTLDHHLQPLLPNTNSKESQEIFDKHRQAAQELVRVQTEVALLHQRKKELADELDQGWKDQQASFRLVQEHGELLREKESLVEIHRNLRAQLDIIRAQVQRKQKLSNARRL